MQYFYFIAIASVAVVSEVKINPNFSFFVIFPSKYWEILQCIGLHFDYQKLSCTKLCTPMCLEVCLSIHCQAGFCFFKSDQILV